MSKTVFRNCFKKRWRILLLVNTLCLLSSPTTPHLLIIPVESKLQISLSRLFSAFGRKNISNWRTGITLQPLKASLRSSFCWVRWPHLPNPDPSFQTLWIGTLLKSGKKWVLGSYLGPPPLVFLLFMFSSTRAPSWKFASASCILESILGLLYLGLGSNRDRNRASLSIPPGRKNKPARTQYLK